MEKIIEKSEVKNPAHLLARRLQENRKSLHIARVPDTTKVTFIALAKDEFCGDYGMTLKWLVDDILSSDTRMILAKIEEQETRIQVLESATHTSKEIPDKNIKTMVDGSKKVVGRSKKDE